MPEQDEKFSSHLPDAAFDATRILENMGDACYVLDHEWRFVYINSSAERQVGRTRTELLGRSIWDEFPEAVGSGFESQYRRAVAEQVPVTFEEFYPPLSTWFEVRAFPSGGGLTVFFQNVDLRKQAEREAEREIREGDALLRDTQARLEAALSAGGIATWTYDLTTDRVVADAGLAQLFSVSPEDAEGGRLEAYLQAIHPDDRPRVEEAITNAVAHKDAYEAKYRVVLPDGSLRWLATRGRVERDALGQAVSLPGVVLDITEQVSHTERDRFLAVLAERARGMSDPADVIADTVRSVGEFLGASRVVFADIDIEADTCSIPPEYRADDTVVSIAGTFPISAFGAFVVAEYKAGRTAVVNDVNADPIKAPPETLGAYESIGVRAYVAAPVMHSARLVSAVAVHSPTPRNWTSEEVELIQMAVERTWLIVAVLRQQEALAREAEALRGAYARTAAILESITDGFITLDRDWHFTYLNDQAERILFQKRDQVLGRPFWDVFPETVGTHFEQQCRRAETERIGVVFEEYFPPLDAWFDIRVYPSDGGLSLFFQNVNERKAIEAERARLAEREHRIATELQEALLPMIPERVPGLRFGHHYRAALQEAGIGGDFASVFGGDKGISYLVVGDLSGKGLAAASQIATVTNMLRFAVHNGRSLAGAVTALNDTLTDGGLLNGFATMFLGRYEAAARTLTYVNCGQDAGLVRRTAGGKIVTLPPTGPVVGAFSGAVYMEETVVLEARDVLALYTDGLTEAGPTRMALLTGDGVADLLAGLKDVTDAQQIVTHLIAGVDAHAGGVISDDQCLLVGIVEG